MDKPGKQTKGRQRIAMKLIENKEDRLITFSKRRSGIYKKANELVTLCGAEVAILVFSPAGKAFSFSHPSMEAVAGRFLGGNNMILGDQADNSHPLFEAHRKKRIDELNQLHNNLMNKLELEKQRGKTMKKRDSAGGDKALALWETPIHELNTQQLHEMNGILQELHAKLTNKIHEKTSFKAPYS